MTRGAFELLHVGLPLDLCRVLHRFEAAASASAIAVTLNVREGLIVVLRWEPHRGQCAPSTALVAPT